mmetsp:Transcript_33106/g.69654  ORF Transcript_33106/g.69654 Transcript_33106/m.69654 type:complete len:498 (+) Transcript_33106:262-1755(+)
MTVMNDANSRSCSEETTSRFGSLQTPEADAIMALRDEYNMDDSPNKISLGLGVYRTEEGCPLVLESVKLADKEIHRRIEAGELNTEYLPAEGLPSLCAAASELLLGEACARALTVQTLGGTGGLHIAAHILKLTVPATQPSTTNDHKDERASAKLSYLSQPSPLQPSSPPQPPSATQHQPVVYLPSPSWASHAQIFKAVGYIVRYYRYYDAASGGLDAESMLFDLSHAEAGSVVLLQACGHNPTGVDLNTAQWAAAADAIAAARAFPLFDAAYHGLVSGDAQCDVWAVRHFAERGFEMAAVQSFSKNMGLYSERVGTLSLLTSAPAHSPVHATLRATLKNVVRCSYSAPPARGAHIANAILTTPHLNAIWRREIAKMASRVAEMRVTLHANLNALACPPPSTFPSWDHLIEHKGMFSFTGLSPQSIAALKRDHHIYITTDGRACIAGLSRESCAAVACAIAAILPPAAQNGKDAQARLATSARMHPGVRPLREINAA